MVFDRVSRLASIPALAVWALICLVGAIPAHAIGLLRDAGIENGLTQLAAPMLVAAGLNPRRVRILIVNDKSLNAFVIDNSAIFIHYGLIQKVQSAAALQAVIAHEAAHIANGHITRRMTNLDSARTLAGLGAALAVIAAASGADGGAATGIALGTSASAQRSFLAHTRAEEAAADRSAAGYMYSAGADLRGLIELHETFRGQELLTVGQQDPYMQSHPLTRDRIRAAQGFVAGTSQNLTPAAEADYWYARLRGKLIAFVLAPKWTMRRIDDEIYPDVRLMREAVAYYRQHQLPQALKAIDGALALRPDDPFYHDLKGEILMANLRISAAIASYQTAVSLAPGEPLILGGYGRALLAGNQPEAALVQLDKSRQRDFRDSRVLRDLSNAYAQTGQNGMAAMVTAERYALEGQLRDAGTQARRAVGLLPQGSPGWQRAQDVLIAAEQFEKRNKR